MTLEMVAAAFVLAPAVVAGVVGNALVILASSMAWVDLIVPKRRRRVEVWGAVVAAAFLPLEVGLWLWVASKLT